MQKLGDMDRTEAKGTLSSKSLAQLWITCSQDRAGTEMTAAWKESEHLGRSKVVSAKRQMMLELFITEVSITKLGVVHVDENRISHESWRSRSCGYGQGTTTSRHGPPDTNICVGTLCARNVAGRNNVPLAKSAA